ncbi:hypothetical protein [Streptomyces cadmiisoli]|uniref:hypothetical protein n=1 Tax=Streptomyces cadmiisoli TaxID=2184053 RepID=UPI003D72B54B
MTYIAFPQWQPGMIINEARANSAALIGRVVFKATRDTNQAISSTSQANPDQVNAISWETISDDELGGWSSGAPTRYTCQLAGWYKIEVKVGFNAATLGTARTLGIYVGTTLQPAGHFRTATTFTNQVHTQSGYLTVLLGVGDYVELVPGQDTGNPLNTATGGVRPLIEIAFARPA